MSRTIARSVNSCLRKKRYITRAAAAAKHPQMDVYCCPICLGFHHTKPHWMKLRMFRRFKRAVQARIWTTA